jgi:hypothetical protein
MWKKFKQEAYECGKHIFIGVAIAVISALILGGLNNGDVA